MLHAFRNSAPLLVMATLFAVPHSARAQIVPPVQVPDLPVRLPLEVDRTLDRALDSADPRRLQELRRLRIAQLLRTHRQTLEADPRGAPILRSEVIAVSPTETALSNARAAGFDVVRTRTLEDLAITVVVLRAPPGMSTRRALRDLREGDPQGTYDFNHIYIESGELSAAADRAPAASTAIASTVTAKVGMIDGGVDR